MKNDVWFPGQQSDQPLGIHQRTDELYQIPSMEEDENGEFECMAIILRELVIFPKMVTPIFVTPGINQNSIAEAHYRFETIIALYVDEENTEENVTDFLPIATEVAVGRLLAMPDGNHSALLQGRRRVELIEILQQEPVLKVRVKVVKENDKVDRKSKALIRTSLDLFEKCVHLDENFK